jgi:O-antigen/teichoic acid export membrane protein
MKIKSYIRKASITGLMNSIGSAVFAIIFLPLLISNIGVRDYGILALLVIFVGISGTADFGLSKAIVYFVPKQKDQHEVNEIFSAVLCLNIFIILIILSVSSTLYFYNINPWNNKDISETLGKLLLVCGTLIIGSLLITSSFRSILEATYNIHLANIGSLLLTILNYALIYLISTITENINALIYASTAIYFLILIYHIIAARLYTNINFHIPTMLTIKSIINYSIGVFFIGVINSLVTPLNRYMVVVLCHDISAYGLFDIGLKVAMIATGCLTAFVSPLLSLFSKYGKPGIIHIKDLLQRYIIGLGVLYFCGCSLFWLFGDFIITNLLHNNSTELFFVTFILLLGVALTGVAEPFNCALLALGDLAILVKIRLLVPIINIAALLLLKVSPLYSIAVAYSLSYAFVSILLVVIFYYNYSYRSTLLKSSTSFTIIL